MMYHSELAKKSGGCEWIVNNANRLKMNKLC